MKIVLTIIMMFTSLACLAESRLNAFTKGEYKLYGILDTNIARETVMLVMMPNTKSQLTVRIDDVNFRKAIIFNEKLVEVTAQIENDVIGKNIIFKGAKIIAVAPQYKQFYQAEKIDK